MAQYCLYSKFGYLVDIAIVVYTFFLYCASHLLSRFSIHQLIKYPVASDYYKITNFCDFEAFDLRDGDDAVRITSTRNYFSFSISKGS